MTDVDAYVIWSHEHRRWWGPRLRGYTPHLSEAGQYSRREAVQICQKSIIGTADRLGALPDLPVRLDDVTQMATWYTTHYPGRTEDWM